MTIQIPLTKGLTAIVDDIDADLSKYKWHTNNGYAVGRPNKTEKKEWMHRIVLVRKIGRPLKDNEDTDHINHNRADNRRSNLRVATHIQNCWNNSGHSDSKSQYKGVCYFQESDKWRASINAHHIGLFDTEIEAAYAHDAVAREKHGKFAYLNFPDIHYDLADLKRAYHSDNTSGYRGVYQSKHTGYWQAEITVNQQKNFIGSFKTAQEAAQAYDTKATELLGNDAILNFPDKPIQSLSDNHLNLNNNSGYRGVSFDKRRNLWAAEITINYKKKHLGRFSTPEQAAKAYDQAAIKAGRTSKLNFPID